MFELIGWGLNKMYLSAHLNFTQGVLNIFHQKRQNLIFSAQHL